MKTGVVIAAAGAGLIGLGVAMHAWPLPGGTALRMAQGPLARAGLSLSANEGGRLTLLPVPRIDIAGVSIRDAAGDVTLRADTLRASIRLGALLTGRAEVADVTLVAPDITLSRDLASDLLFRASGLTRPGMEPAGQDQAALPDLQRIVLTDARVASRDADGAVTPLATGLNLVLARGAGTEFDLSAALSFRGEGLQVTGSGLRFARSAEDGAGPLDLVVTSDIVTARISGRTTGGANAQTDGELLVKTPSLERLSAWLDLPPPLPLAGPVEIAGTMRLQPGLLSLSNARIALAAGQFDGVLALRPAGDHLAIDGTVAADTLDLTAALSPVLQASATDGWSSEPYAADLLPRGDADLRISAGKLTVGRLVLANAALSVLSRGGRVDAVLSNADLYKGSMKARLSLAPRSGETRPGAIDVRLASSFERVDVSAMLGALADQRRLSGLATGSLLLEGSGDSPLTLVRSLDGKANAGMRLGELVGIDVPDVLKRLERRPLLTAIDIKGGRTSIETGAFAARIGKGVVEVSEASLNAPTARIVMAGQIGLGERQLNLSGTALAPGAKGQDQTGLPFEIVGSFDDPRIFPDARSLIRRSGAAPALWPHPAATEAGRADALGPVEPATP